MIKYLFLLGILLGPSMGVVYPRVSCTPGDEDIYSYSAALLDESNNVTFSFYKGKVMLIVNTATYDDLTTDSYNQINALAETFSEEDFEILGFPCPDFGKLEPGEGYDEITNGIKFVFPGGGFVANLTFYEKTTINGDTQHPVYGFLKSYCPYTDTTYVTDDIFYTPQRVNDIYWNFEKFLLGRDGKPYTRYHPTTTDPLDLEDDIRYLLSQPDPNK